MMRTHRALLVPLAFILALFGTALVPRLQADPRLFWSIIGAAAVLLVWQAVLSWRVIRSGRPRAFDVSLRSQHYVQFACQAGVLLYWGSRWAPVYDHLPHLAAQFLFAYAFDILLAFSRRERHTLGFGPLPVVLSTNLFMWFRDEWFYWQFLMNAGGMAGKELIRWTRDGRRVHIFNPSALSLSIVSLVLIVTGHTSMTWGQEIASTLNYPAQIYAWIFGVGLIVQYLFGVTLMTLSAVVTVCAFSLVYAAFTGVYYFFDSHIPIAVFLGMHLLFTDPSTSPRSALGRIIFGMLYGCWVIVLYQVLGAFGAPTFYDKLLGVPFLNLSVRAIDGFVDRLQLERRRWLDWLANRQPLRLNPAFMALWIAVFLSLQVSGSVGDAHEGAMVPFWQRACAEGRRDGCRNLAAIYDTYCESGSGWACNELAVGLLEGARFASNPAAAVDRFRRSCQAGFAIACTNAELAGQSFTGQVRRAPPQLVDFYILLSGNKGRVPDLDSTALLDRACGEGWAVACSQLGDISVRGDGGLPKNFPRAHEAFRRGCDLGDAGSCSNIGLMYRRGDGVTRDDTRALEYLERACSLNLAAACGWLKTERDAIAKTRRP